MKTSLPLSLCHPPRGEGQARADEVDGGAEALLVHAPERLQLDSAGGDVEGDQGGEIKPVGAL